jgi:hypothetical protein
MKKVLAALAASGVLIAGGFVTSAVSAPTTAVAQEAPDTTDGTTDDVVRPEKGAILDEVLADLVTDGVIDSDQATKIKDALEAKHEELREQFGDRGQGFRGHGGFRDGVRPDMSGFLEDGVIDADELAQLPDGHPLTDPEGPAAEYLDDGRLTAEELEELHAEFGERRGHGPRGFGGPAVSEEASIDA